jgi:dihydroorotase
VHHLSFSEDALSSYDPNLKLVPPLRHQRDVAALIQGLAEGVIDAVVSDHRPQSSLQKDCEFSDAEPGAVGLSVCFGLLFSLVLEKELSLARAISALTTGPARVLGLPAPSLVEGRTADLVLVAPDERWAVDALSLRSKSQNSPLLGRTLPGRIDLTLAQGQVAFDRFAEPLELRRE